MNICLTIIKDNTELTVIDSRLPCPDKELNLADWAVYSQQREDEQGECLYLLEGAACKGQRQKGRKASFLCIGEPVHPFFTEEDTYLVFHENTEFLILIEEVHRIFQKFQQMEKQLLQMVYKESSMQEFIDYMYPFFRNEIIVMNSDFYFVAFTHKEILMHGISGLNAEMTDRPPLEVVNYFKNDKIFAQVKNEKEPFLYHAGILMKEGLCMNILKKGEFFYRIVVTNVENPYREYDGALLKFFGFYIQKMCDKKEQAYFKNRESGFLQTMKQLISGEQVEGWKQQKMLLMSGWKAEAPFLCICILPSERDYYNNTISYYCDSLTECFEGLYAFEYRNYIACVVNLSFYQCSEEMFISRFIYYQRESCFQTGFGNRFYDLNNLCAGWKQAEIALKIGMQENEEIWSHRFSDVALDYMLNQMDRELDFRFLCSPKLMELCEYDEKNQTSYFETLKKYLQNERNVVKTAADLFIHRGTMIYRLKRIKEMTGLSLEEEEELLYLRLSMKLLEKSGNAGGLNDDARRIL